MYLNVLAVIRTYDWRSNKNGADVDKSILIMKTSIAISGDLCNMQNSNAYTDNVIMIMIKPSSVSYFYFLLDILLAFLLAPGGVQQNLL